MKIELQEPYSSNYRVGYLRYDKYGRGRVDLIRTKTDRTTISYARYLMEINIGQFIPDGFEVDHIDGDCSNDNLDNIQILSRADHIKKTAIENTGRAVVELICPCCGIKFEKEKRFIHPSKKNNFCSRRCNGKFSGHKSRNLGIPISEEKISEIKRLAEDGLSGYRISKITGISANTVLKYMK